MCSNEPEKWLPGPWNARLTVDDIRGFSPNIIIARGGTGGTGGRPASRAVTDCSGAVSTPRHVSVPRRCVVQLADPVRRGSTETPAVQGRPGFGDLAGPDHPGRRRVRRAVPPERTGEPTIVDSSLLARPCMDHRAVHLRRRPVRHGRHPRFPPGLAINPLVNRYRTKDGRWLQLVFLQPDRFWAGFCERIGVPELATDQRFVPSAT